MDRGRAVDYGRAMAGEQLGAQPIRFLPTDDREEPASGVGLCLSGGGYRAMVFHLGALWRLNELAWLPKLDRVSSVSGGSITAGALGLKWGQLDFSASGMARAFTQEVVAPIRKLAAKTLDVGDVLKGFFL